MKFTKRNAEAVREYLGKAEDGVLPLGDWTSGSGRFTSNRALPPFTERYERVEYPATGKPEHGTPERKAMEFFERNPRRKAVLVMDTAALAEFLFENAKGKEF